MAKLLLGSVVGPQGPQGTPGVNGSQGPQGIPGPNEVTATTDVVGLTTGQLLYNNGGKVGSVEIVDDLTSTATDKPLSANKGRVLGEDIHEIDTTRGYVYINTVTDLNNATESGRYKINNGLNQPVAGSFIWAVDVVNGDAGLIQRATCVSGDAAVLSKTYERIWSYAAGGWQAWKEIPDKSYVDSAIGQIANDRGYIKTKQVTDFNLAILNGKYSTYDALNSPISGGHTWVLNVTKEESGVISQIAHCVFGIPVGRIFIRHLWGTWSAWKEIAIASEVLSLSGGDINGNLNIGNTANSALRILRADDGIYSISAWKKNNPVNDFLELRLDGSISGDWSFKNAFCVRNTGNGALYKVYHEGNVTVSTSAPSSTLTNGCIHHVY